jgi:hypothetical protein
LVVTAGGVSGTLGDRALDDSAARIAETMLDAGMSAVKEVDSRRLYFERHAPALTLVVFGATHVAMPLVSLGKVMGLRTVVVDGRDQFATRERFPVADEILVGMPSELAEQMPLGPQTLVVLLSHDYKYDLPVLKAVLPGKPSTWTSAPGLSRRRGGAARAARSCAHSGRSRHRRQHTGRNRAQCACRSSCCSKRAWRRFNARSFGVRAEAIRRNDSKALTGAVLVSDVRDSLGRVVLGRGTLIGDDEQIVLDGLGWDVMHVVRPEDMETSSRLKRERESRRRQRVTAFERVRSPAVIGRSFRRDEVSSRSIVRRCSR